MRVRCYFFCIDSSAFVLVCSSKDSTLSVLSVFTEVWIHGHTSTQPTISQLTHNKKYINISINNDEKKKNSISVESSSLRRCECFTVHACQTVCFFFCFFFLDEHVNHEPQFIIVPSTRIAIWKVGKRHVLIKSLLISDLSSFFYYSLISVCVLWFFFFHFSWRITRGVFKTDRFRGGWGGGTNWPADELLRCSFSNPRYNRGIIERQTHEKPVFNLSFSHSVPMKKFRRREVVWTVAAPSFELFMP